MQRHCALFVRRQNNVRHTAMQGPRLVTDEGSADR